MRKEMVVTLSQEYRDKAARIGARFVKNESFDELSHLVRMLAVPEKRQQFISQLRTGLKRERVIPRRMISVEFAEEVVKNVHSNAQQRLAAPDMQPEPPPSEEIDAMCET